MNNNYVFMKLELSINDDNMIKFYLYFLDKFIEIINLFNEINI